MDEYSCHGKRAGEVETPTEYKLLTYLVKNKGRVIPHRTLMEKV